MLKGRTHDEDLGSAVNYSWSLPSLLLSSPTEICVGSPRSVPWENRCTTEHDGKKATSFLQVSVSNCSLSSSFSRLEEEDRQTDSCQALSASRATSGPCPWGRPGCMGAWQPVYRKGICRGASHQHRHTAVAQTRAQMCYLPCAVPAVNLAWHQHSPQRKCPQPAAWLHVPFSLF